MQLRSGVGKVELSVVDGQDRQDGHWGCPIREWWGLEAHQRMSPVLEERLAFTATMAGSYEAAALVAQKWGCAIDDSVIHALVSKRGGQAQIQMRQRLKSAPQDIMPPRKAAELAVLMVDGWQARFRGAGWGRKRTQQPRVEWHEMKMGVFYRHDQAVQSAQGRGELLQKTVVQWLGPPQGLARKLHYEALRQGLARSQAILVLGDGSPWIWNLAQDRWPQAVQTLDFYHAGEHLWALGRELYGEEAPQTRRWVEYRLHQLRHGQETKALQAIARLQRLRGVKGRRIQQQQKYFAKQAHRMHYQQMAERGWPIGSGAVESACRQSQCRFKRSGQFWTMSGLRNLCALDEARHNGYWNQIWSTS